ncbi:MAG: AraC family transcriptional regulator, partial [Leptolyngbya sp.]|nr:AraC family transcriptional regulator [Candidatus Melainabacteria bacterium]
WLVVEGVSEPVHLNTHDCFLLPHGRPFVLASDLSVTPIDAMTLFADKKGNGAVNVLNGGGTLFGVGGHFAFDSKHANILLSILPPFVHISKESDKATMRWSLEHMMKELRDPQPGSFLVVEHLAQMILVQALRLYLGEGVHGGVGWLFALSDEKMSLVITAIHENPSHRWTLQEMAERAEMSRSTFALKFKEKVGISPMEYLTNWRMILAGDKLTNSSDSVSMIAEAMGYESESAFSTAFKRVLGSSPRQYVRNLTAKI